MGASKVVELDVKLGYLAPVGDFDFEKLHGIGFAGFGLFRLRVFGQ
jgi:hypothetical protein